MKVITDAFLAKYDPTGGLLWAEQLGTSTADYSCSVTVDGAGNAFISGYTGGSLGGPSAGGLDAFLAKYDPAGNRLWSDQATQTNMAPSVSQERLHGTHHGLREDLVAELRHVATILGEALVVSTCQDGRVEVIHGNARSINDLPRGGRVDRDFRRFVDLPL